MANTIRHNIRVPLAGSARLSYASDAGPRSLESTVASISLSGIGLYADCMLSKNTAVSIQINFISSDGLMKADVVEGSIVNANELQGLCYLCVVFNEDINPQKQPFLYTHLQKILRN
jgi:hypothetical protein